MKLFSYIKMSSFMLISLLLVFSGCASTPVSRFYTLDLNENDSDNITVPVAHYKLRVTIGPVEIPDYLDQPQIMSRTSRNELALAEFDRWAGSLKEDIARVLSENLSSFLSHDAISVTAWQWGAASDYRIAVSIKRFDIMPQGYVLASAGWHIIGKDSTTVLFTSESSIREPIVEDTYAAKVSSMSKALRKLSQDIAEGVRTLSQKRR